jgi:hypothetical protein
MGERFRNSSCRAGGVVAKVGAGLGKSWYFPLNVVKKSVASELAVEEAPRCDDMLPV